VSQPTEVQRLLAAAREAGETELNVSWSATSMGGHEGVARFTAVFNRMYDTSIQVNFTPGPSMPDMIAKVAQELAAGRKASGDLLLGNEVNFATIRHREVLEEYDYSLLSPRILPKIVADGNIGVEIYSAIPAILYQSDLVPAAQSPKTLQDVLAPRWKGLLATTPYGTPFEEIALRPDWGPERTKAFITRLSEQAGGLIRLGESSRIVSGEFPLFVMGNVHGARQLQRQGAPIGYAVPPEGAIASFVYMGVPRNSGHPNLAKLFVNTVVSEEGQRIIFDLHGADHHALPGSQAAVDAAEVRAKGSDLFDVNVKVVLDRPEMTQLAAELERILAVGRGG
jgi:iron(III) transport system substrate-binding protein